MRSAVLAPLLSGLQSPLVMAGGWPGERSDRGRFVLAEGRAELLGSLLSPAMCVWICASGESLRGTRVMGFSRPSVWLA
jgi:hypothetical protein